MKNSLKALIILTFILNTGCLSGSEDFRVNNSGLEKTTVSTTRVIDESTTITFVTPTLTQPPEGLDLNEANVVNVEFTKDENSLFTFAVTVRHNDTGWEHYVDWWRISSPDGEELGRRVLLHPHESEQPFTRSLSGISIPQDLTTVVVEAHDSLHGFGGQSMKVDLVMNQTSILFFYPEE